MTARIRIHMFDFQEDSHHRTPTSKVFENVFQLLLISLLAACAQLFLTQHFAGNIFRKGTCSKDRQTHGCKLASEFKRSHVISVWMGRGRGVERVEVGIDLEGLLPASRV